MYHELLQSRKNTYCSLLLSRTTTEEVLEKVSSGWTSWLRNYYTTTGNLRKTISIPFHSTNKYHQVLLEDIIKKQPLIGFPSLNLYKFPPLKEKKPFIIPLQPTDTLFQYDTITKDCTIDLPKRITNHLDHIYTDLKLFGVKRGEGYYFFYYLTKREWELKKDLSKVTLRLEELKKLTKSLNLRSLEGYYNLDGNGLYYDVDDGFFDIEILKDK